MWLFDQRWFVDKVHNHLEVQRFHLLIITNMFDWPVIWSLGYVRWFVGVEHEISHIFVTWPWQYVVVNWIHFANIDCIGSLSEIILTYNDNFVLIGDVGQVHVHLNITWCHISISPVKLTCLPQLYCWVDSQITGGLTLSSTRVGWYRASSPKKYEHMGTYATKISYWINRSKIGFLSFALMRRIIPRALQPFPTVTDHVFQYWT